MCRPRRLAVRAMGAVQVAPREAPPSPSSGRFLSGTPLFDCRPWPWRPTFGLRLSRGVTQGMAQGDGAESGANMRKVDARWAGRAEVGRRRLSELGKRRTSLGPPAQMREKWPGVPTFRAFAPLSEGCVVSLPGDTPQKDDWRKGGGAAIAMIAGEVARKNQQMLAVYACSNQLRHIPLDVVQKSCTYDRVVAYL